MTQTHYIFGRDIKDAGVLDNIFHNISSDIMSLEVYGNFSGIISVEAKLDKNNEEFIPIVGIDMSELSLAKTINKNGIYQYSIEGINDIRINVKDISGNANITAKMINSAE
jgi:hypothetical protein